MLNRIRLYLSLAIAFASFSALVGFSYSVAGPYTAAEALEEAIRGAQTREEVRSRIEDYYRSVAGNRLLLLAGPGLAAAVMAGVALRESVRLQDKRGIGRAIEE